MVPILKNQPEGGRREIRLCCSSCDSLFVCVRFLLLFWFLLVMIEFVIGTIRDCGLVNESGVKGGEGCQIAWELGDMANACGESTSRHTQNPSCSGNSNSDNIAGDFECNICFELPQDPIVTLCGHLFCWPCLHKWLRLHAHSPECPVCKAIVQEDKLVPLYGRGKTPTDPRSKPVPGVDTPPRPTGMRPETAPPQDPNYFAHHGLGFMGGFPPVGAARMGNHGFVAGFGGLFPSLFNFHVQAFPDPAAYAAPAGLAYGFGSSFHGGHANGYHPPRTDHLRPEDNSLLTTLFLIVGAFVIFALLFT
ncbi:hypothetical protein Taro_019110 [Colocasia esculenta]|uniref:E3 ubiquitin-protein ligase RMA n=1 Tax=Colocasia esculenta TaxID=4460 RepID=A0A843UT35_COLES|nr:hypothetical protein [Colocasia esculenta]